MVVPNADENVLVVVVVLLVIVINLAITCEELPEVVGAVVQGGGFEFKAQVHYKCREGYYIQGSPTLTCGANGKWIGKPPVCKGKFKEVYKFSSGQFVVVKWFSGQNEVHATRCNGHVGFHTLIIPVKNLFVCRVN